MQQGIYHSPTVHLANGGYVHFRTYAASGVTFFTERDRPRCFGGFWRGGAGRPAQDVRVSAHYRPGVVVIACGVGWIVFAWVQWHAVAVDARRMAVRS